MPCILDEGWMHNHVAGSDLPDEEVLKFFAIPENPDYRNRKIWIILAQKVYEILKKNKNNHFDTLQKDLVQFFYALYQLKDRHDTYLERKEKDLYRKLKEFKTEQIPLIIHGSSHKEFKNRLKDEDFQKKLFNSLVCVKGFFDVEEFKRLFKDGKIDDEQIKQSVVEFRKINDEGDEEDNDEKSVQGEDIKQQSNDNKKKKKKKDIVISIKMPVILKRIHKMIMESIKVEYAAYYEKIEVKDTKRKGKYIERFSFELGNMNEKDILTLQKCLKVTRDGSFTGIIKNVTIQDKISDLYAVILDKLEVNTLTIVDTCGLDHVTIWNEKDLKKQVNRLHSDYVKQWDEVKENQQDQMMETGILYIKKLDSGKPDELNSILPIVREMIPSTPVYCMFSGIDIFYRTEQEIDNILWKKNSANCPKAVRYILENDMGIQDIADANAYKVLKNNLIPFCGDEKLVCTKFAYYRNNVGAVRKLLTSIAMKESSSMEIIDQSFVEELGAGKYDEQIGEIIHTMFETASLHSRYEWWNTKKADILSFFRDEIMGYKYTYNHMLYYLFHKGYVTAIREKGNILFVKTNEQGKEVKYKAAVIASLYNMENLFLGINENLIDMKLEDNKKNEFRQIIEKMYQNSEHNPFSDEYAKTLTADYIKQNRDKIFDEVFEFTRYLKIEVVKGKTIHQELVELFRNKFLEQIKIDNNRKVTYLVKMNEGFVEELDNVKKEFCEKYGDKESEGQKMFETFMRYYFSDLNKMETNKVGQVCTDL